MATFADVNTQNFQQFQNLVPQLRQFSSVEGFAGSLNNPSFSPTFLSGLQQSLSAADASRLGDFTATDNPLQDVNFLVRTGQVAPSSGGLLNLSDFSSFGLQSFTEAQLDQALGQTRRVSSDVGSQFGVLTGSNVESQFFGDLFNQVVGGTPLGDLNLDLSRSISGINTGSLSTLEGRQEAADRFRAFAEGIGLTEGSGTVNPFRLGFGESTPGTLFTSGGTGTPTTADTSLRSQIFSFLAPTTQLEPGTVGAAEEFQNLLQVLGRVSGAGGAVAPAPAPTGTGGGGFTGGRISAPGGVLPTSGGGGGFTGGFGGFGGGSFDLNFGNIGTIPSTRTSLKDFFQGRDALVSQGISDLAFFGPRAVDKLQAAVPELGAAADVAAGAFGADFGSDFSAALREAAAIRGVDPSQIADFNAGLAANTFLGSSVDLATQTGFEQLLQAGFAPPQNFSFGTLGSLNLQQAELSAQIQSGIVQSQQAQALFAQTLPGLLSP